MSKDDCRKESAGDFHDVGEKEDKSWNNVIAEVNGSILGDVVISHRPGEA